MFHKLKQELKLIITWNPSDRSWQMPLFAGFCVGLILFIATLFEMPNFGLVSVIGAMIFLYVPETPIYHKMILSMSCAFGIIVSFTLGLLGQSFPSFIPLIVFAVTLISAKAVRYFSIGSPGFFFFAFATILGTYIPFEVAEYPMAIGLVALGTMVAVFMVLVYALFMIYVFKKPIKEIPRVGEFGFGVIIIDPMIIAFFVGFAMFLQAHFELERGYWVGISCAAVMTAVTFKQIWIKQLQRIVGTIVGVSLAYFLLHFVFTPLEFAILMMILMFFAELVVQRNYALSMVFLTPYSTYLAEAASFMQYNPEVIIQARVLDIIIGSLIGLVGGACMHWGALRRVLEKVARRVFFRWKWRE
ncbi:MAG: FUSC family protein [Helicobacter sp.]|nr:FUSC family protein [Helicobacteraceae bacterium]MDY3113062.1 FUSC family protein [Helicobacter sp.]